MDTFDNLIIDNTMVIPYTVSRYFTDTPTVSAYLFLMWWILRWLVQPRLKLKSDSISSSPESVYNVENLTQLVAVAVKPRTL